MPTPRKPVPKPEEVYGNEHAKLVAEVLEDQERKRKEEADRSARDEKRRSEAPFFAQVGLLVMASFSAYLFFFSPSWVVVAQPPPPSEAALEPGLWLTAGRWAGEVDRFRSQRGVLPTDAVELEGFVDPPADLATEGIAYARIGPNRYTITATGQQGGEVTYDSSQDLDAFMNEAPNVGRGG